MYYAGIGSRETPAAICAEMTQIARWLFARGYTLRSGAADGADKAFEAGAGELKEIFLPWFGFNGSASTLVPSTRGQAADIARVFHPAWGRCSDAAKKLHIRNVHQVLGGDLRTRSAFVVCWTKDGGPTGGTGQALRIADHFLVPVFNLHDTTARYRLQAHVDGGVFA